MKGITQLSSSSIPIKPVMLRDEDQIEEDADVAKPKLDRIARDAGPVALQRRVDEQLHEREDAAGQIEQDLLDAPADGRLALVVCPDLRQVLYECDQELDVANRVDLKRGYDELGDLEMTALGVRRGLTTSIQAQPEGSFPPSNPHTRTKVVMTVTPSTLPAQMPRMGQVTP